MPEYLGYQVPEGQNPIDFAGITAKITSDIKNVKAEKQAQRDAIDQDTLNTQAQVDEAQLVASKTQDEMMYEGAISAREKLYAWQKELKAGRLDPRDFAKLKNKLSTGVNNYKNYMTELGTLSEENMKRMQPDENGRIAASWAERLQVIRRDEINNPANLTMTFSDIDGGMVFVEKDSEGNTIRTTTQNQMMNMNNMYDNTYHMDDDLSSFTDTLADWVKTEKVRGGTQTSKGAMVNEDFNKRIRPRIINTVLPSGDDKRVADILIDNGGYYLVSNESEGVDYNIVPQTYSTDDELNQLIDREVSNFINGYKDILSESTLNEMAEEIRDKSKDVMIGISYDKNGKVIPNINDTHKKMATDAVDYAISAQLGQEDIFKPKAASTRSSSSSKKGNGELTATQDRQLQLYLQVEEAINDENYSGLRPMFEYNRSGNILSIVPKEGIDGKILLELGFTPGTEKIDLSDPNAGQYLAKYGGSSTVNTSASDWGFGKMYKAQGNIAMSRKDTSSEGQTTKEKKEIKGF